MNTTFKFWDETYWSGQYRNTWHYDYPTQELVTLIASGQVQGGNTLDLGCGGGTEAAYLAKQGVRSHGIDWSPNAIRIAKQHARKNRVKVQFVCGTILDLPYPDAHFTFVNDRGCFHHIQEKDRPRFANEVARVLKASGHFLLRGARPEEGDSFVPIRKARLKTLFSPYFEIGPIQEITLVANVGSLKAFIAVMRRK
jgi:ubiquinone/menaquinone biosynthesis C-methylase UbiE